MNRKPWPILLLALFQWLSPIGNFILSATASHMTFSQYFHVMVAQDGLPGFVFGMCVPTILAGIAI